MWGEIFRDSEFTTYEDITRAEALLNELRPESPLWHRLSAQLAVMREHAKRSAG